MPAKSKKQQKFFGMVHALQKGDLSPSKVSDKVKKVAKDIDYDDADDFASTKHKGLPNKVEESDGYDETPEELKVKKDAVQSGMPKTREKRMKENKNIRLRDLLEEGWMDDENVISEEDKVSFLNTVRNYNQYGKHIYREGNLVELAETLAKVCQMAERLALQETSDWFDDVTVKRNFGELKKLGKDFHKVANEAQSVQDRMVGMYEDMGHILGRYFDIEDLQEAINPDAPEMQQDMGVEDDGGEIKPGDKVNVDFDMLKKKTNVKPYLKTIHRMLKQGNGVALVVDIKGNVARVAASELDAQLGTAKVPVEVLQKAVRREINE